MWLLSGAFFPLEGAPVWLGWLMRANPLTYGVSALRSVLDPAAAGHAEPSIGVSLGATVAFAALTFAVAHWVVCRRKPAA